MKQVSAFGDSFFRETWMIIAGTFALSVIGSLLGAAAPALAILWVPAGYYAMFRAPVHVSARILLVLGLFIEPPEMMPGAGYWVSPLEGANNAFYGRLRQLIGIPLPVSLFLIGALVIFYRARKSPPEAMRTPAAKLARRGLYVFLAGVVALEAYGVLRGGNFEQSTIQALPLFAMPFVGLTFLYALRGKEDLYALANIIVSVAIARSVLVAYVYWVICRPQGVIPEYATTHGDSTTFASAALILLANVIEQRNGRTLFRFASTGLILMAAMVMNNRRLAFVGIGLGALMMYLTLPPSRTRKKVNRYLYVMAPLLMLYILAGEGQEGPLFAPARLVWSSIEQKDGSAGSRTVENTNLVATLADSPILGQGFGWEYKEVAASIDLTQFMKNYRFVPHNSVLWLWTAGAVPGFLALWLVYVTGIFFAARAYRFADGAIERASTLACVGMFAICMSTDWGDVGAQSNLKLLIFAVAYAAGARVCADAELRAASG
jgi:O-Antigen ligase